MNTVKPCGADVYLHYKCRCGAIFPTSIQETKFPGGVRCHCGAKLKFLPIESIRLKIKYSEKRKKTFSPKCPTQPKLIENDQLIKDCYGSLVSIGYSKKDAKQIVDETMKQGNISTVEQFIRIVTASKC